MKWEGNRESDNVEDRRERRGHGGVLAGAASASAPSSSR